LRAIQQHGELSLHLDHPAGLVQLGGRRSFSARSRAFSRSAVSIGGQPGLAINASNAPRSRLLMPLGSSMPSVVSRAGLPHDVLVEVVNVLGWYPVLKGRSTAGPLYLVAIHERLLDPNRVTKPTPLALTFQSRATLVA
jgi:hypothetical protein